jgi:hypothetical protein
MIMLVVTISEQIRIDADGSKRNLECQGDKNPCQTVFDDHIRTVWHGILQWGSGLEKARAVSEVLARHQRSSRG